MSEGEQNGQRRRWFMILGAVVAVCAIAWGLYWFLVGRNHETTDDAYVSGNIVTITSREAGTVLALHADDTQSVRRGQLLVELDPTTARVNLEAAQANLATVARGVRGTFSKADLFRAQLREAQVGLRQAEANYHRRQATAQGAVSGEELAHARDAVDKAEASVHAAQSGLDLTLASIEGTKVADNPEVLSAAAKLRAAMIVLSHMRIVAPVDGVVARRTVQPGQHVAPGVPLMAVVPLNDVWIDANFKENQLDHLRIGQPVTVTTDIYGRGVTYHGHVEGLGAGSGSAFALLPPQNASGNWIKVVQRVPVRIAIDAADLRDHPLRVGLSVTVTADVRDRSGAQMATKVGPGTTSAMTGEDSSAAADAMIARILRENGAGSRPQRGD